MLNKNLFDLFPNELVFLTMNFLSLQDIFRLLCVSKKANNYKNAYPWENQLLKQYGIKICRKENAQLSVQSIVEFEKNYKKEIHAEEGFKLKSKFSYLYRNGETWACVYWVLLICSEKSPKASQDILNMNLLHADLKNSLSSTSLSECNLSEYFKVRLAHSLIKFRARAIDSFCENVDFTLLYKYYSDAYSELKEGSYFLYTARVIKKILELDIYSADYDISVLPIIFSRAKADLFLVQDSFPFLIGSLITKIVIEKLFKLVRKLQEKMCEFSIDTEVQELYGATLLDVLHLKYDFMKAKMCGLMENLKKIHLPQYAPKDICGINEFLDPFKKEIQRNIMMLEKLIQDDIEVHGVRCEDTFAPIISMIKELKKLEKEYLWHEQMVNQLCFLFFLINDIPDFNDKIDELITLNEKTELENEDNKTVMNDAPKQQCHIL